MQPPNEVFDLDQIRNIGDSDISPLVDSRLLPDREIESGFDGPPEFQRLPAVHQTLVQHHNLAEDWTSFCARVHFGSLIDKQTN
jgi:hypothetical protein